MEVMHLLDQAAVAGLSLRVDAGLLTITGPKRLAPLAALILAHKAEVLASLDVQRSKAAGVVAEVKTRCNRMFLSQAWQANWECRHGSPSGHLAARRGVEAVIEAAEQQLARGEWNAVHATAALALRIASGVEFDRGPRWQATSAAIDIVELCEYA